MHKDFEKLQQAVEELLQISEGKILFEYAAALENLRTMVRKIYDKHETGGKVSMIEMGKYDRLLKMEKEIEESLKGLYKSNALLMDETLKNIFVLTRDTTLQSVAKGVPEKKKSLLAIAKKLDIDATVNEKMAGLHWAERMGKHRSDVIYGVNKTLKEGLAQGSTYKELSDRLKKELEGNVVQPMRIIRTESGRVYAKTQQESLDRVADARIQMVKTWKSSKDERVRSQHQEMEGVTIPYEEEFTLPDGTKTKAPRLSGAPQHDIHCRCFITIDLAEYADEELNKEENRGYSIVEGKNMVGEYQADGKYKNTIEDVIHAQGFDGPPRILSRAEFEKAMKESNFYAERIYAGNTPEELERFKKMLHGGKWYVDCTVGGAQYGQGMYCAACYDIKDMESIRGIRSEMVHYGKLQAKRGRPFAYTEGITLDPSAKILILPRGAKASEFIEMEYRYAYLEKYASGKHQKNAANEYIRLSREIDALTYNEPEEYIDSLYQERAKHAKKLEKLILGAEEASTDRTVKSAYPPQKDPGVLAVEMGYDAINAVGHGASGSYTVILNRTKVILHEGGSLYEN